MNALVVGGASGIGLSMVLNLVRREDIHHVYVVDKNAYPRQYICDKIEAIQQDLSEMPDMHIWDTMMDINMLYITAGYGHLISFGDTTDEYIQNIFAVNSIAPIRILHHYFKKLQGKDQFTCAVMVSIAGRLSSPMFSLYSATKSALCKCIEAMNIELEVIGNANRVLEVSPGSLKGTSFTGGVSDPSQTADLAAEIIERAERHETVFIPQYDEVFKSVIERYQADAHKFGVESYFYKQKRMKK